MPFCQQISTNADLLSYKFNLARTNWHKKSDGTGIDQS
jgi:hypothetical protein